MEDYIKDELILTGTELTISELVHTSRQLNPSVRIHNDCFSKMSQNRKFAEKIANRGDQVYGLTTGVGVRKNRLIPEKEMGSYNEKMLRDHATGQGDTLPYYIVHASTILLLNTLAAGRSNVRPEVAKRLLENLRKGRHYFEFCILFY